MLLLGLLPLPYGYYTLLRVLVTAAAALAAYLAYRATNRADAFVIVSVIVAVAFNPFIPVHLDKGIWSVIDLTSAGWFILIAIRGHRQSTSPNDLTP